MEASSETLADRLNHEPVIFRGSSSSELLMILIAGAVFWLPFGLLVAGLLGALPMGIGIAALGILGTVYFGSTLFQWFKRGRPENYYQHRLAIWLGDRRLRASGFVRRTGVWDLGRLGRR